ncbi:hypothetical protein EBZ39_04100 [bacterium]|nr:hypothetical protein [bacterium]
MEVDTGLAVVVALEYHSMKLTVYNTINEPLIAVDSVKGVSEYIMQYANTLAEGDTLMQVSGVWFFTEFGLYETLLACKQYIPQAQGLYKFIREKLKALRDEKVLQLESELREARGKVYEEILKEQMLYITSTECGVKVSLEALEGSQSAVMTHNAEILMNIVKYILHRYSCNAHEDHYHCDKEYTVMVVESLARMIDTLKSTYSGITKRELHEKIKKFFFLGEL